MFLGDTSLLPSRSLSSSSHQQLSLRVLCCALLLFCSSCCSGLSLGQLVVVVSLRSVCLTRFGFVSFLLVFLGSVPVTQAIAEWEEGSLSLCRLHPSFLSFHFFILSPSSLSASSHFSPTFLSLSISLSLSLSSLHPLFAITFVFLSSASYVPYFIDDVWFLIHN